MKIKVYFIFGVFYFVDIGKSLGVVLFFRIFGFRVWPDTSHFIVNWLGIDFSIDIIYWV